MEEGLDLSFDRLLMMITYIHTHIHQHTHTYIYIYTYIHTHTYIHIHTYIHTSIHTLKTHTCRGTYLLPKFEVTNLSSGEVITLKWKL